MRKFGERLKARNNGLTGDAMVKFVVGKAELSILSISGDEGGVFLSGFGFRSRRVKTKTRDTEKKAPWTGFG